MDVRILNEEELINAAGLSRYVFDVCLRNRMEFPLTISYVEEYLNAENIQMLHRENKLRVWGVFEFGQLIAVSGLQSDGMITLLYVLPQYTRKGIGKKLLFTMREYAKEKYGFERVSVNANPAFTSFYFKNQGFVYADAMPDLKAPFVSMYALSSRMKKKN